MTQSRNQTQEQKPAAEKPMPGGRNPRHVPLPPLQNGVPQPATPPRSELEQQQDQQPVQPEPLLERVEEREGGKERELRNG